MTSRADDGMPHGNLLPWILPGSGRGGMAVRESRQSRARVSGLGASGRLGRVPAALSAGRGNMEGEKQAAQSAWSGVVPRHACKHSQSPCQVRDGPCAKGPGSRLAGVICRNRLSGGAEKTDGTAACETAASNHLVSPCPCSSPPLSFPSPRRPFSFPLPSVGASSDDRRGGGSSACFSTPSSSHLRRAPAAELVRGGSRRTSPARPLPLALPPPCRPFLFLHRDMHARGRGRDEMQRAARPEEGEARAMREWAGEGAGPGEDIPAAGDRRGGRTRRRRAAASDAQDGGAAPVTSTAPGRRRHPPGAPGLLARPGKSLPSSSSPIRRVGCARPRQRGDETACLDGSSLAFSPRPLTPWGSTTMTGKARRASGKRNGS